MSQSALIIIDCQQGFRFPEFGPRNNPEAEAAVGRALAAARRRGIPVLHVRHDSKKPTSPLRPGQRGNDFAPEARPEAGEPVISKTVHSALIGTDLGDRLAALNVSRVVLAGIATDHCVSTTARMACDLGYDVTVLSDATAAFDRNIGGLKVAAEDIHRAALASLSEEFATIMKVDEVIDARF